MLIMRAKEENQLDASDCTQTPSPSAKTGRCDGYVVSYYYLCVIFCVTD